MRASRRQFLKTCSLMSIAGAASPFALNLAAIGAASAQSLPGYKAIVCLFFYGGNDHTNTFIPVRPGILRPILRVEGHDRDPA